jgi:hypothetical protein
MSIALSESLSDHSVNAIVMKQAKDCLIRAPKCRRAEQ